MLWGNRNLKIDGKCLYSKFMIDVNLLFFKDVVLHNGKINGHVYNSLQNKIHYFKDITMINKLVRRHKNIICENININNPEENTIHVYKKSKQYYTSLKIQKQLQPKSFNFWANQFEEFSFEKFYNNKIKPMHVAKVREYLFKIIHNIGVCGEILFRWKILNSKKCFYCDNESHTFKHMIWECEHCEQ